MSPTHYAASHHSATPAAAARTEDAAASSSSEEEDEEEEEAVPDMKALTGGGGDLPQEFWQVGHQKSTRKRLRLDTYVVCTDNWIQLEVREYM